MIDEKKDIAERKAFETWVRTLPNDIVNLLAKEPAGRYFWIWRAWQARAALQPATQPQTSDDECQILINQGVRMLEDYAEEQDKLGNNSTAEGAKASAYIISKMASPIDETPSKPQLSDEEILEQWDKSSRAMNHTLSFSCALFHFTRAILQADKEKQA